MHLLRKLFYLLNIVAVLAFLASSVAGWVRPSHFVWFSLFSYAFYPLLLLNLFFILFWLLFHKRYCLLSVIAIALRFSLIPLIFQTGGCQKSDEPSLKVLAYNVHHFYGCDFVADVTDLSVMDSNAHQFFDLVDSLTPHLLCIEEFIPVVHKTDVNGALEARDYRFHACAIPPGTAHNGVVLYSRLPILNIQAIDSISKMSVDVLWDSDTLRLFCLHLGSYQLNEDDYKEIDNFAKGDLKADSLKGTIDKFRHTILRHDEEWQVLNPLISSSPYPTLVMGDFNDTPTSYIYQKMRKLGFLDAFKEQGKGFSTTYHGKFPAFRIDYLLHSKDIECLSYQRPQLDISDHYPIFAQFRLKEKEEL